MSVYVFVLCMESDYNEGLLRTSLGDFFSVTIEDRAFKIGMNLPLRKYNIYPIKVFRLLTTSGFSLTCILVVFTPKTLFGTFKS